LNRSTVGPAVVQFGPDRAHLHARWSAKNKPIGTLQEGETVNLGVPDASNGQLTASSTARDLLRINYDEVDAAVGPLWIPGAKAGDALAVHIDAIRVGSWGWSGVFRRFGLLQDRFDDDLVIWSVADGSAVPRTGFLRRVEIPLSPMLGWIGVAPARGDHGMIPPLRTGGNMDSRLHSVGTTVILPIEVDGALLSIGDPHAAMGDGEVCGTGIETPAEVQIRVEVLKGGAPPDPRSVVRFSEPTRTPLAVASGIAPDLLQATRRAVENMMGWLTAGGLTEKEAYVLISVAGNLRISEAVDLPNYVVSLTFPPGLKGLPPLPATGLPGGKPSTSRSAR
jgi:acetamidase/formamidase